MFALFLSVFFSVQVLSHPFFISICQIHHNAEAGTLEIAIKIFADDLETALEASGAEDINLEKDQESDLADQAIGSYIGQHLRIEVDGKLLKGEFIGKEVEADVIWCYVEARAVEQVTRLKVFNDLLMDQFDTQTNIVHVTVGGKRKSMLLQKGRASDEVIFE